MMERKTDPSKIPDKGERLDQTFLDIGRGKSYNERTGKREDCVLIKSVVDSGQYKGRKLTCPFFSGDTAKMREFRTAISRPVEMSFNQIPFGADNFKRQLQKFIIPFNEDKREVRFSASVEPVEFETDQGRYIRYDMTFFDRPTKPREIEVKQSATQFER